jgi:hypothetical protein
MIAKISTTGALYSTLAYNQTKVDEGHAKVIFTSRMVEPRGGEWDIATCLRSFEPYLTANRNTEKPVLHISLNPDPDDRLTDGRLSEIAQEYLQRMGYGDQPFIVYKHEDIDRHHIHIVTTCVREDGKKISDKLINMRSMGVCRDLEQKYGLVAADGKKRREGLPLKPILHVEGDVKHQISNVIRPVAGSWHFQSLKEYRALLTLYNIGVDEVRGEVNDKPYRGLVYCALDGKGEKVGAPFKSSLFGKSVGIEALEKRFEKSTVLIKERGLKERSRGVIAQAMRTAVGRDGFERALETQGVSVLFRTNAEGRIYGATFIDHEQRCVFNGSRLGKEFSANVFNDLFSGNHRAQDVHDTHGHRQPFEPLDHPSHDRDRDDVGLGGLAGLLSPDYGGDAADNAEEKVLLRRTRKRKRLKML